MTTQPESGRWPVGYAAFISLAVAIRLALPFVLSPDRLEDFIGLSTPATSFKRSTPLLSTNFIPVF